MRYKFDSLSPADFEELAIDLLGEELRVRFESFGPGPDGGVDGRHASAGKSIILQAKHYVGSTFPVLKSAMKRERASIDNLAPQRYILATSRALTPRNKATLAPIIGPALQAEDDIFGPSDLNRLLKKFPAVERANIKLWLSGSVVLDRILHAAAYSFTEISRAEIEAKVRIYAQNPSFKESRDKLETNHVLIISGPPGVGKTTLAEMLSYAYIGDGWEFVAIRNLEDGFAAIVDANKQIFFFDDFLGKVALDARSLASKDSDLAKFLKRVRTSPNARFVLTTRAYIFEEARRVSEHLADPRLDIAKYVLDVGIYTRRIKARILYNHLVVAGTPTEYVAALWVNGSIRKIVDHKNYNPRIIEAMTDNMHVSGVKPENYPTAFLHALDSPHQLWDTAFRTHITPMCRHLLICLFFCSEYGVKLDELKPAFGSLHRFMCKKYSIPHGAKDFEEALKVLEGSFIVLRGRSVSLVNPSLRDYLASYLDDAEMVSDVATTAIKTDWAAAVWRHIRRVPFHPDEQSLIAGYFGPIAEEFSRLPVMKKDPHTPNTYHLYDLCISDRVALLLEWWSATGDERYSQLALSVSGKPVETFQPWLDGVNLVRLICDLRTESYGDFPYATELISILEGSLIEMLDGTLMPDDLEQISSAIEGASGEIGQDVSCAANNAIMREVGEIGWSISTIDSVSVLEDQMQSLSKLALHAGVPSTEIEEAVTAIQARIAQIEEDVDEAPSPSFSGPSSCKEDKFNDEALSNLFAPLIVRSD